MNKIIGAACDILLLLYILIATLPFPSQEDHQNEIINCEFLDSHIRKQLIQSYILVQLATTQSRNMSG